MERHGVLGEDARRREVRRLFSTLAGGKDTISEEAFVAFVRGVGECWADEDENQGGDQEDADRKEASATFFVLTGGAPAMTLEQFEAHLLAGSDGDDAEDELAV